jgi:predicted metal-dependent peptidase
MLFPPKIVRSMPTRVVDLTFAFYVYAFIYIDVKKKKKNKRKFRFIGECISILFFFKCLLD